MLPLADCCHSNIMQSVDNTSGAKARTGTRRFRLAPPGESATRQEKKRRSGRNTITNLDKVATDLGPLSSMSQVASAPTQNHQKPTKKVSSTTAPARMGRGRKATRMSSTIDQVSVGAEAESGEAPTQLLPLPLPEKPTTTPQASRALAAEELSSSYNHAGRPPTRKKKHGGSLTHLPMHDNYHLEGTMGVGELENRRMESANYITDEILDLGDPGVTVYCHKGRIRDWKVNLIVKRTVAMTLVLWN